MSKGYKYHYHDEQQVMVQYIWPTEDKWKKIDPSWIHVTDLGCYPNKRPTKGDWHLSWTCDKPQRWGGSYWIQKQKRTDEPILFVLPCNSGVLHGNYFKGGQQKSGYNNNWRIIDLMYRDLRDQFCLAAVDCLIYCSDYEKSQLAGYNDSKGCLVFEWEMDRVKSQADEGIPDQNSFVMRAGQNAKVKRGHVLELSDHIMVGLKRALDYGFEKIFAHLAPVVYRCAFAYAVERMNIWDKVCLLDFRAMLPGVLARNFFRHWYRNGMKEFGIYDPLCLHTGNRSPVAERYFDEVKFWNYKAYHKDWEPKIYSAHYTAPMIDKQVFVRERDVSLGSEGIRTEYNIAPNLRFDPEQWRAQFGPALAKYIVT